MNKQTKSIFLLIYLITFICTMIVTKDDVSKLTGGILISILFGVGGTLVDRDIVNLKRKEKERDMVNRIIRTSRNTRDNYN